jgi:hypothetical protein
MTSIETPCIQACLLHPTSQHCIGCGRSLDEIAHWIELGDSNRAAIMAQLPARLAAMRGPTSAPMRAADVASATTPGG